MTLVTVIHFVRKVALFTFLLLQLTGEWLRENMAKILQEQKEAFECQRKRLK
jgi:hypothetical protein